jgi:hypothetical protein
MATTPLYVDVLAQAEESEHLTAGVVAEKASPNGSPGDRGASWDPAGSGSGDGSGIGGPFGLGGTV